MPVLRHAKKKLKQDKKRTTQNRKVKDTFKSLIKDVKKAATPESVGKAFSAIDKAAKQNILPKNRASRMKSSLSKILTAPAKAIADKPAKAKKADTKKKTTKKPTSKKK